MPTNREVRRPPCRYFGGKWTIAPWIISHFPHHRTYVEPYAGGASVLLSKPRCFSEVYNDVFDEVVNLFTVLRNPGQAAELQRVIELTPYARVEFDRSAEAAEEPIEKARRFLVRSFMGYGCDSMFAEGHTTGFRDDSNKSGSTPARDWWRYPSVIPSVTRRLQGVVNDSRPAIEVIEKHDRPTTLIYVDPPYPNVTRGDQRGNNALNYQKHRYAHDMDDDGHRELARVLRGCQGMVVISGYPCPLYDEELYPDWTRHTRRAFADGAEERVEAIWINRAASMAHTPSLFAGGEPVEERGFLLPG